MTLKPCPFCGEREFVRIATDSIGAFAGICSRCGADGPGCAAAFNVTQDEAAAEAKRLWNTRTLPLDGDVVEAADALDRVSEALREVHALSGIGDDAKFDASMFGQIAAVERGASLLRRTSTATHSGDGELQEALERIASARSAMEGGSIAECRRIAERALSSIRDR